eukprot:4463767-Alexandrium_andersonii.AAC.1
MTTPELPGNGLGLELRRLLAPKREVPEQPVAQRGFQRSWADLKRRRGMSGPRLRFPQWEAWGSELAVARGRAAEEDMKA